jgi:hypothetical protein
MIWLANYNAGPISYTYGSDGKPTPIATVNVASRTWYVTPISILILAAISVCNGFD